MNKTYKFLTQRITELLLSYQHYQGIVIIDVILHPIRKNSIILVQKGKEIRNQEWDVGTAYHISPYNIPALCEEIKDFLGIKKLNKLVNRFEKYFKNVKVINRDNK